MGKIRLIEYLQFIYGPSEGHTAYFMDRKQDLRLAQSTVQKVTQKAPREGSPIYFLTCFIVLLRQLRRLYISGPIFQVPLVYNYSTCRTNRVLTHSVHQVRVYAFSTPTTYILTRPPLISQHTSGWCTERVNAYLVYRMRKHAVSTTGAVIIQYLN